MTDTAKTIQINQEIPDFESDVFHNEEFKKIKLADYRGRWLVLVARPAA